MRPLRRVQLDEINASDMITFERTKKDGSVVSQLAFVSRANFAEDDETIESFELLPMVPSNEARGYGSVKTYSIERDKDLQCSGLDIPHTVYGFGITVTPDDFPDGGTKRLGYLHESIADNLYRLADSVEKTQKKLFNLKPNQLSGIHFPAMKENAPRPPKQTFHEHSQFPMEEKKRMGYPYEPVESGGVQPSIIGNPWENFTFK